VQRWLLPLAISSGIFLACAGMAMADDLSLRGTLRQNADVAIVPSPSREFLRNVAIRLISPSPLDQMIGYGAPSPSSGGFRGAVEESVFQQPRLRAALSDYNASKIDIIGQMMRYAPVLNARIDVSQSDEIYTSSITKRSGVTAGVLSLSMPIYSGGQIGNGINMARAKADASAFAAMATRDDLTLEMISYWLQANAGEQEISVIEQGIARLSSFQHKVSASKAAGFASSADVVALDAEIAAARRSLTDARARQQKAVISLMRMTGRTNLQIVGTIPSFDKYLKGGKNKLMASADRKNPRLRAAAAGYQAAQFGSRQAFGRHLPQVNLTGEYRHPFQTSGIANGQDTWTIGVRMQVPLLDLSTTADTLAQSDRMDAALYREADTRQSMQNQIDELWIEYVQLSQSYVEILSEVAARKRVTVSAINRFKNDFGSLQQISDSEFALQSAQISAIQINAKHSLQAVQLLMMAGLFQTSMLQ
jgi:outer membrane protein